MSCSVTESTPDDGIESSTPSSPVYLHHDPRPFCLPILKTYGACLHCGNAGHLGCEKNACLLQLSTCQTIGHLAVGGVWLHTGRKRGSLRRCVFAFAHMHQLSGALVSTRPDNLPSVFPSGQSELDKRESSMALVPESNIHMLVP
jgi:hypothetical protein